MTIKSRNRRHKDNFNQFFKNSINPLNIHTGTEDTHNTRPAAIYTNNPKVAIQQTQTDNSYAGQTQMFT